MTPHEPIVEDAVPYPPTYDAVPSRGGAARWITRVIIATVVGLVAGTAVMIQIRSWGAVTSEAGGSCGGVYGACPRGTTGLMIGSIIAAIATVPITLAVLFRRPRVRALVAVVAVVCGVFLGQNIFTSVHGATLGIAWSAPFDSSDSLVSEGFWPADGAIVRVRVDRVTSYGTATGQSNWTYAVPGQDVVCAMSAAVADGIGLIAHAAPNSPCGQLVALDLATGRRLWSAPLTAPEGTDSTKAVPDLVTADGDIAAVLGPDGVTGLDIRTGRQRWSYPSPAGCAPGQVAAGHGAVVAMSYCDQSIQIADLAGSDGTVRWTRDVPQPSDGTAVATMSCDPVVINEVGPAPRDTETLLVFGGNGQPGPNIDVGDINTSDGPVRLDTDRHAFDAAPVWWAFSDRGMLVGVTRDIAGHTWAVGYRLSDGHRQWLTALAADALAVTEGDGRMSVAYADGPVPVIASLSVQNGASTVVGVLPGDLFADEAALVAVPGGYVAVNTTGTNPHHPVFMAR